MGFTFGLVMGVLNFVLLTKLIHALLKSEVKKTLLFLGVKFVVIATSLLITALLMPHQLGWNGIGLAIPLILGGFFYAPIKQWIMERMQGRNQNE